MKIFKQIRMVALLLGASLFVVKPSLAQSILYTVSYDPTSQVMWMSNSPSSTVSLEFWPSVGANAFTPYLLAAGGVATITGNGVVTGGNGVLPNYAITNKSDGRNIVISNTSNSAFLVYFGDPKTNALYIALGAHQSLTSTMCMWIPTNSFCRVLSCDLQVLDMNTSLILNSPNWPGPPATQCELVQGSLLCADDLTDFMSVFSAVGGTGCIPEPSTTALVLAGIGSFLIMRRQILKHKR